MKITHIGGPTALIEVAGLRLLTDPTFDPKGSEYKTAQYTLRKLTDPAICVQDIGRIDFVLLSHDHHFDNLDRSGRELLARAGRVYTTTAGAGRLGGNAVGLENWQSVELPARDGRILRITGTPARHGPADADRGPVTGFVLNFRDDPAGGAYISGDTVWYEGIAEIARRFDIRLIILFMGAARVKEVGNHLLTMTAEDALQVADHFPGAQIVPVHYEGWAHFSESRQEIESKFSDAGRRGRLRWIKT